VKAVNKEIKVDIGFANVLIKSIVPTFCVVVGPDFLHKKLTNHLVAMPRKAIKKHHDLRRN
jgi:hypothetical protein